MTPRGRIDVHAHYLPEVYRDALVAAGQDRPDGIPVLPEWSVELALAAMEQLEVRLAILSISSPGVHFGDAAAAAELARGINETGAQITRANPGRFGFFAVLPLPEVDETPWFRWRLGLLDFDQGLVGPFRSVEDGFELCGR
jgi:hypothetical protein